MTQTVDQTLAALADPTRRAVVDLLGRRPYRPSELATALSASRPTVSRHLRVLRRSGIVEETGLPDDARVRVYRLRPEPLDDLHQWLEEVRAFWGGQLNAFKAFAEAAADEEPPV